MRWYSFPSGTTWLILGMTIVLIALVWVMGALIILDVNRAEAELRSELSSECVRGLEALSANMDVQPDSAEIEREQARQEGVLSVLTHREGATPKSDKTDDSESSE